MNDILDNEKTWNAVADIFKEGTALPVWGPFGIGDDLNLIPEIDGRTFLEIGCGSGRSIKYLTDHGADKVYGLDLSSVQLGEATKFNEKEIKQGKVKLIKGKMEDRIVVDPVDVVFSIYGFGWTTDPASTLRNIHSYLKPGGLFIWSWDHIIFRNVKYEDEKYIVVDDYHNEKPRAMQDWRKKGCVAHITYRKTATWFRLLKEVGFEVVEYHEPEPKNLGRAHDSHEEYYSIDKAKKVPATFIFVCKKS